MIAEELKKNRKRCYLAGSMTGIESFNFPAFFRYEGELVTKGYQVFNPARNDLEEYGPYFLHDPSIFELRKTLKQDLMWICQYADCIALIPGWENSSGVAAELALARALKLKIIYLD